MFRVRKICLNVLDTPYAAVEYVTQIGAYDKVWAADPILPEFREKAAEIYCELFE